MGPVTDPVWLYMRLRDHRYKKSSNPTCTSPNPRRTEWVSKCEYRHCGSGHSLDYLLRWYIEKTYWSHHICEYSFKCTP